MIASLRGTVAYVHPLAKRGNFFEIEVNGIGYRVEISAKMVSQVKVGQSLTVHTYLEVREDAQELFGFLTRDELQMFHLLLSVQRVGPRSALHVLDLVSPQELRQAVAAGSPERLVEGSGVGQRMAEIIVAGLRGKIEELAGGSSVSGEGNDTEARDALIALGFPASEAQATIAKVKQNGMKSEEIIRAALKVLGQASQKREKSR
ncbi:MAG: Holliday junction branch migration protein RuvA [Patescibacteria group bacterium]|nr:Holliday junction branch migration protein RuvA [Patescibacteria group bacterium]